MSPLHFFSPSGGLVWHLRALRYRRTWAGFNAGIAAWLGRWAHGCEELLLIGPSAGWCLPQRFICAFGRVHALDLDPLAPWLFGLAHPRAVIRWERADVFEVLPRLLSSHPRHAILFANLLGQHALHAGEAARASAQLQALTSRLTGRRWASFHDRISGDWPTGRAPPEPFETRQALPAEALAARVGAGGVWLDHLTEQVLPAVCARHYLPWPIVPGRLHWIEAGHVG